MPSEPFDWPGQQPPQAGSSSPAAAGFAHAGLAEAAPPPARSADGPTLPDLLVRTQRSEHMLHGGTTYRIGRDPESTWA